MRFPRIVGWRTDKPASEADTLQNLQAVLENASQARTSQPPGD